MFTDRTRPDENRRFLMGIFGDEADILGATRTARDMGLKIADVYAPYAVHGLDQAMGLRRSRLPWITFAFGLLGAGLKIWFEFWTTAVAWPINVGGKPVGTVIAFLINRRLLPGKKAKLPVAGVTDDLFALVLEETDAAFDLQKTRRMFEKYNVIRVEERVEQEPA